MSADPGLIIVMEVPCNVCGTRQIDVHHQTFPELAVRGESPAQAAQCLANCLENNLDAVVDPSHREPVRHAIADVQAYLAKGAARHRPSEVIDVAPAKSITPGAT